MNNNITVHYALFISEGARFFTSTESLSSLQQKMDETTRNCLSSFVSFGNKTKYEAGAFWYGPDSKHDYFVFTFVIPRLDELAKRPTNFRYQAILPLTDFNALSAAGYDIKSIITRIFTKNLLIKKNKGGYQPELAKPMTPEDIKLLELFDYQSGLKPVQAAFQDQTVFEDSLAALIYDNGFQLQIGKADSAPDWNIDSADLKRRQYSQYETFVMALWHLLPLQTRMHRRVSTGLPDKNDAMYKSCQGPNAITLQFQNNTSVKEAAEQALTDIDTNAKDFLAIKTLYVKPLLAAIEANDTQSVLELQQNYTVPKKPSQPIEKKVSATPNGTVSTSEGGSNPANGTLLKWLPIGIIAFLLVTILWLWVNQTPKTINDSQIAEWQQSHQQLTQIKKTVLAEPWSVDAFLQDWQAQLQSQLELARLTQAMAAEKPADVRQPTEWQQAYKDLAQIKQTFDAEDWSSETLISHLINLKHASETEAEAANQQLELLQALLSKNWNEAENQIKTLPSTDAVIANQAAQLLTNIQTWQNNSVAYQTAQADTAQSQTQANRLQKEHGVMQSVLNALIAKNWAEAKNYSYRLVNLPEVNNLIDFIDRTKTITEQIKDYQNAKQEAVRMSSELKRANLSLSGDLERAHSALRKRQDEFEQIQNNLQRQRDQFEQQVQELNRGLATSEDNKKALENQLAQLDKLANRLDAGKNAEMVLTELADNNNKAQDLLKQAQTSINATALNTAEGGYQSAKDIYFQILRLSENNPYVEATVGLFYGIPEKYKNMGSKRRYQWLRNYEEDFKQAAALQPYLAKFNAGSAALYEYDNVSSEQLTQAENLLKNARFDAAINVYRQILSADTESAQLGLTVLVPLYYLQNNDIGSALEYLNSLAVYEKGNHYAIIKDLISNIQAHYQARLDAEKEKDSLLSSINQYHALFKNAQQQPYRKNALNTIKPKVQVVFEMVDGYLALLDEKITIQQDLESKKQKALSDQQKKISSLSSILWGDDCAIQKGYYRDWVKPRCTWNLKVELPQLYVR